MNTVQIIGRLTKDPEVHTTAGEETLCAMRLAVDRMGPAGSVGYVDVSVFGRPGAACAQHLTRGWLVAACGRLRYREWETQDGAKRSGLAISGDVEFLAAPRAQSETGAGQTA